MTDIELDKLIAEAYNYDDKLKPILDGIIDSATYNGGISKILWILKEPYDLGDGLGGWDSRDDIRSRPETYFKYRTWKRIAFTSYGILNNTTYEKARVQPDVFKILKSIAYINLNKYPAKTTSSNRWKHFENTYIKCKSVLMHQIKNYNPDIIIIGNITYLFLPDFNLTWNDKISLPLMKKFYFNYSNKLLIDAYHPSVPGRWISESDYCTAIIDKASDWLGNK